MERRDVIDRPARDRLIQLLDRVAQGQAGVGELRAERYAGEDETVGWIVEHFIADAARLPLSKMDDREKPSPRGSKEMERAVAFLRTDAELAPPRMPWYDRAVLLCCAVFLAGGLTEVISNDRLVMPVANAVRLTTAIAGGFVTVRLLIAYLIALGTAGAQIFRVRVLRHEISDVVPGDIWPFEVME